MKFIDLNCDLGEGAGHDAELMMLITSANIACGGHAGDRATMRATIALAERHGVAVGAHPGFADRENFGRKEMILPSAALHRLVTEQVGAVAELTRVWHVKPHGALYNLAARERGVAETVAAAVHDLDASLVLFALAGSELARAGRACGLRVAEEVFADRAYQRDGALVARERAEAVIADAAVAAAQVVRMVREGRVRAIEGVDVPIVADTVCVHGDGPQAVAFARRVRQELTAAGVGIRALA